MNERILELADKAVDEVPFVCNIPDEFCEAYANWIIQECADRIKNELHSDPNENEPINDFGDGYNAGIYSAIRAIKDHFGIHS